MKHLARVIFSLAFLGLVLSSYAFLHNRGFVSGSFCAINATVNCDVVNKGPYSAVGGVPVAFIGILGYALIFFAAFFAHHHPRDRSFVVFLVLASMAGLLFSGHLTYLEAFVLHAWCIICLASQGIIFTITVLSWLLFWRVFSNRASDANKHDIL